MRNFIPVLFVLIFSLLSISTAQAQGKKTFLYGTCSLVDEVESAYFIYLNNDSTAIITADSLDFEGDAEAGVRTFVAEVSIKKTKNSVASFWIVCRSTNGQSLVGPRREVELSKEGLAFKEVESVRDILLEKKQLLADTRKVLEDKNAELTRLKADASVIGGYERLTLFSDEVYQLKNRVEALRSQIEHVQKDLERLQFAPVPMDLPVRERIIKHNINLLSREYIIERSKQSEAKSAGADPQQLSDLSNQYDLEALENQLNLIRTQRISLEQQYGQVEEAPAPNQVLQEDPYGL
jgi:hypothetical protein